MYFQVLHLIIIPLRESNIKNTVIVIDGLDQCENKKLVSEFLSVLRRFVSEVKNIKFLITSRPALHIEAGFRCFTEPGGATTPVLHTVELSQDKKDVGLFLFDKFSKTNARIATDHWPEDSILDSIVGLTGGLFYYAQQIATLVDRCYFSREDLDRVLSDPGYNWLTSPIGLPEEESRITMCELYKSALHDAVGDWQYADKKKLCSILGAVVLAKKPMSASTIAILFGFYYKHVLLGLKSVQSLLILHEDRGRSVKPFHKSFSVFLTKPDLCTNKAFYVSPPIHHRELLIACLQLMNQMLEEFPHAATDSSVDDERKQLIDEALIYACTSWHEHLVGAASEANTPEVIEHLHLFLQKNFSSWKRVLSHCGAAEEEQDALTKLEDWLRVRSVSFLNIRPVLTETRLSPQRPVNSLNTVEKERLAYSRVKWTSRLCNLEFCAYWCRLFLPVITPFLSLPMYIFCNCLCCLWFYLISA